MKTRILAFLILTRAFPVWAGGWPVIDVANLEQALKQVGLAKEQVELATSLLKHIGDPAALQNIIGAAQTIRQLGEAGVGKSLPEIQANTTGQSGLAYDGRGLYRPIEPDIPLAGGQRLSRPVETYRKFEALQKAVADYDAVTADTKSRRASLRAAQAQTTEQLSAATTDAEVQKLKGVLASQESALNTLAAERSEAATRVAIQQTANEADRARHQQADDEARAASLQSALQDVVRFFKVDSHPTMIPNPKSVAP